MADDVNVDIRALVHGLQDVRNLVREIERLPDAGKGAGTLSASLRGVTSELKAATAEARNLARETTTATTQANASVARVPASLRAVRSEAKGATSDIAANLRQVSAIGTAVQQAFSGNVLGVLRSVGTVLRQNTSSARGGVTEIKATAAALNDVEKVVKRFSGILGSAAKNPNSALSKNLLDTFAIEATTALAAPELATQKLIASLGELPTAELRAAEAAGVFGASTAQVLPIIEAEIAATERLVAAQAALLAAEETNAAAQATVAAETAAATDVTTGEVIATDALTEAELAAAAAAEALTKAQLELAAANGVEAAAADVAAASTGFLEGALLPVALAIGAVLAIGAGLLLFFGLLGNSAGKAGEKVYELGIKSGLSFANVQTLALASREAGKDVNASVTGFDRYIKNVNEAAAGNKNLAFTMQQLGINTKTAAASSDNALEQLFRAISKLPPGAQQVDAAMKLAGKAGADLIPIIDKAGGSFENFKKRAQDAGKILSDDSINAAHQYEMAMADLGTTLEALKNTIGSAVLPILTDLATSLAQFIQDNREGFTDLGSVISVAFKIILGIFYAFGGVVGLLTNIVYAFITVIFGLIEATYDLGKAAIEAGSAVDQFIHGDVAGAMNTLDAALRNAKQSVSDLREEASRALTIVSQPTFTSLFGLINGTPGTATPPKPAPTATFRGGSAPRAPKASGADQLAKAQEELEKARLQATESLERDSLKRQEEILKQHFQNNLVDYKTYYDQLAALQLADLDVQLRYQNALLAIQQKQLDATKKAPDRLRIQAQMVATETKITELERKRGDVSRDASFEAERAAKAYARALQDIQVQLLESTDRTADAARLKIDEQFRDLSEKAQARAKATGDTTDLDEINRLKERLKLAADFAQLENQIKNIEGARAILADELNVAVAEGAKTQAQANAELRAFDDQQRGRIDDLLAGLDRIAATLQNPALLQAVAQIRVQLGQWRVGNAAADVDELKHRLELLSSAREDAEKRLALAIKAGQINERDASDQRDANNAQYIQDSTTILDLLDAIAQKTHDADLGAYVAKARTGLVEVADEGDKLGKQLNDEFLGAFRSLFTDLASGTKTAKQAFVDFGLGVLQILQQVLIKIILTKLALAAFGGGGGVGGFLSGLFGGDKAAGNYASGGLIVGAGTGTSDSVPINASNGEFVVNAAATAANLALLESINGGRINPSRNLAAGGQVEASGARGANGTGQSFKIVNVLPNDLLEDYVTSGDGGQALLNFIEYNAGAVKTRLNQ